MPDDTPAAPAPEARAGALAPLRYPAFRMLAAGATISQVGNAMAPIALAFAVLDLTGSVTSLGLVVGARSVANVVFLLLGGVLADRLPRRTLIVGSAALSAASQSAVAALVLTHTATIGLLAVLSAVNGTVSAANFPASAALLPQTVPAGIRQQANVIARLGLNAAAIGGASVGGVIVATVGPGWGLAVDAASFLAAGCFFALVRVAVAGGRTVPGERAVRASTLTELREGWTEFVSRTWVWVVVLGFMFLNAAWAGGLQVLGPVVADATIGRAAWGVVLATQTLGMVVGGLVALRLRMRRLLRYGVACMAGPSLILLALAVRPAAGVLLPAAFLAGLAAEQFGVAWVTSMQQYVPADKLGRVYSYDALGSFLAIPLGQAAAGPVASAVGSRATLLGAAGIVLAATLLMLASRSVRTLSRWPDPGPDSRPAAVPAAD